MGRFVGVLGGACLVCGLWSSWVHADNQWSITSPYPGNPTSVAVLEGKGQLGDKSFPVQLELSCHPDAAVPRAVLRMSASATGWDMRMFDGVSGGSGQRVRSFAVFASNRRLLDRPRFSGSLDGSDNSVFSWQPNEALLAHLARAGDGVRVRLSAPRRSLGRLEARFVFPSDASDVLIALAPCSKALHGRQKGGNGQ